MQLFHFNWKNVNCKSKNACFYANKSNTKCKFEKSKNTKKWKLYVACFLHVISFGQAHLFHMLFTFQKLWFASRIFLHKSLQFQKLRFADVPVTLLFSILYVLSICFCKGFTFFTCLARIYVVHMFLCLFTIFCMSKNCYLPVACFSFFYIFKIVICQPLFFCSLEIGKITFVFLTAFSKKNVNSKSYVSPLSFCWKKCKIKRWHVFPNWTSCIVFFQVWFYMFDFFVYVCSIFLIIW